MILLRVPVRIGYIVLVRVAKGQPVWKRAVHSMDLACPLRIANIFYCSFPFGFEGGIWDLIVRVP